MSRKFGISPSLSYEPADLSHPILDISIGSALRTAASEWPTRVALVEGIALKNDRRRGRSSNCWWRPKRSHVRSCRASAPVSISPFGPQMDRSGSQLNLVRLWRA